MPHTNSPTTRDLADKRNGRAKTSEKTSAQVIVASFGLSRPELTTNYGWDWFAKVRKMRTDPTISLIRDLIIGPILSSEWSIGHTDDAPAGAVDLIYKNTSNIRKYLIEHALTGLMDFGWQAFEKIWAIDNDGSTIVDKIKPLLQDITQILVDTKTGEYLGIIQNPQFMQIVETHQVGDFQVYGSGYLKAKDTILCNINVEGTYWYGRPIMRNVVIPYDGWVVVNETADRYDKKIAGSHWVIGYPMGSTLFEGTLVDNFVIAQNLIQSLESSGAIAIPRQVDQILTDLNKDSPDAWKVEILSDTTNQQSNFIDRLKYYDNLKVRALGFPERSVVEGKFGTKAEAEVHSDLAVVIADYRHAKITEQISYQVVNDLLRYNYGPELCGCVYLKPAPIADDLRIFLRQVFLTLMQHDPETALHKINADEVKERLGLPKNMDENDDSSFKFPEVESDIKPGGIDPVKGENTDDKI